MARDLLMSYNAPGSNCAQTNNLDKENIPPPKLPRIANISGLLDGIYKKRLRDTIVKPRSPLQLLHNGVKIDRLTKRSLTIDAEDVTGTDVFGTIKKARNEFNSHSTHDFAAKTEEVCRRILARLEGVDVDGKPLGIPGLPTKDDHIALQKTYHDTMKPLADDSVTLRLRNPDGSITDKQMIISQTIEAFSARMRAHRQDFEELRANLHKVDEDITAIQDDLLNRKDAGFKKVEGELKSAQAKHQALLETIQKQAVDEAAELKKEAKAESKRRRAMLDTTLQEMLENTEI